MVLTVPYVNCLFLKSIHHVERKGGALCRVGPGNCWGCFLRMMSPRSADSLFWREGQENLPGQVTSPHRYWPTCGGQCGFLFV